MSETIRNFTAFVLGGVLAACLFSCLGNKARESTLLPAAREAWEGVRPEVEAGIKFLFEKSAAPEEIQAALQEQSDLERAMQSGLRSDFDLVDWPVVDSTARQGIQAEVEFGVISELVVPSLLERLLNLGEAIKELQSAPAPAPVTYRQVEERHAGLVTCAYTQVR